MPRLFLFYFVSLAILAQSCGYSLVGKGTALPPGVISASIPLFGNRAGEPNLESTLTNAVKDAFLRDGRLSIKSEKSADAKISGVVDTYSLRSLSYDSQNRVTSYQATISAHIVVTLKSSGAVYMRQRVETNWRYEVDPSVAVAESSRQEATSQATKKMAEQIVSLVIDAF